MLFEQAVAAEPHRYAQFSWSLNERVKEENNLATHTGTALNTFVPCDGTSIDESPIRTTPISLPHPSPIGVAFVTEIDLAHKSNMRYCIC